jgi:replicative DNA helicase
MQNSYKETLNEMAGTPDFQKLQKKVPQKKLINSIAMEAASRAMNRRVFESLKKIANGETEAAQPTATETEEAAPVAVVEKPKTRKTKKAAASQEG